MMLREIHRVKQEPQGRRRWFQQDGLEFILWLTVDGSVEGFQLCYAMKAAEYALTWRPRAGFTHAHVETGDTSPLKNETPILLPDGAVPWDDLTARFRAAAGGLEPALRELILARLSARS